MCLKINYTVNMTRVSSEAPRGSKEKCSYVHISKSVLSTNELQILCTGVGRTKYTPCVCGVCAAYVHKL